MSHQLSELGTVLAVSASKYDNIILMCDFEAEPTVTVLSDFCEIYNLKNIVKDKTCFNNPNKTTCIDLIITNEPKSFQNSKVIEAGLSDFRKMCVTVMKMYWSKQKPCIIHYRKLKDFNNDAFIKDLRLFYQNHFMKK